MLSGRRLEADIENAILASVPCCKQAGGQPLYEGYECRNASLYVVVLLNRFERKAAVLFA